MALHAKDAADPGVKLGLVEARQWSADQNTTLRVEPKALIHLDLTGDGRDDLVIDERGVSCDDPEAEPRLQGSAGSRIVLVVDDKAFRYVAREWFIVESMKRPFREIDEADTGSPTPIILLARSGIACDGAGYEGCIAALIWQADQARFNEAKMSSIEETWSAADP